MDEERAALTVRLALSASVVMTLGLTARRAPQKASDSASAAASLAFAEWPGRPAAAQAMGRAADVFARRSQTTLARMAARPWRHSPGTP